MHHKSHEVRGHIMKRDVKEPEGEPGEMKSEGGSVKSEGDVKSEKNSDEGECENPEESQTTRIFKDECPDDEGMLDFEYSPPR